MAYPIYYVEAGDTLPILFDTFDGGTGASITLTGLAVTDIEIYKDGSVTQRASDAGYTLLDTDGIDFDGVTGIHGFSIDLSDDTTAGFYAVGSWYHVVVSSVTVDAQTVNFIAAAFRIVSATRGMAGTALPDAAADAAGGLPISDAGGLDLDAQIGTDIDAILTDTGTTLQAELDAIQAAVITNAAGTDIAADIIALKAVADAVLVDTGTTLQAEIDAIEAAVITNAAGTDIAADIIALKAVADAVLVDTGTTLQAELDGIQADTEDIQTRLPAALTAGGNMKSDALAVSGSTTAADKLERAADSEVLGTCDAGGSETSVIASSLSPTSAVNDQFIGRVIIFAADTTTTALRGQATTITDYVHLTLTFTVDALTTAPADGDTFVIV